MLVAKEYSDDSHESASYIKAIGAENPINQEAGALEKLMQSIYHVSLCNLLF